MSTASPAATSPTHPNAHGERREIEVPRDFALTEEQNLARLPWRRAAERPQHVSFETFAGDVWHAVTAEQHLAGVTAVAQGLIASGVGAGDRVALMAPTSYEWMLLDQAIWGAGAATVPIYPSSSPAQVEWVVRDSGAHLLIVENTAAVEELAAVELPGVEILALTTGAIETLRERGADTPESAVRERVDALTLDDLASLIYTSGTTGRPKGCMITHRALAAEVQGVLTQPIGRASSYGRRTLTFLPLAHVLARSVTYAAAEGGSTVGFWADFGSVSAKFTSFKPDMILGVPRVFEKVHDGIRAKARAGGPAKAEIFRRAERVAIEVSEAKARAAVGGSGPSLRLKAEYAVFDRLVFRAVRAALGGRCELAISGGGPLGAPLQHFFTGLGVPVYEGYGLTESCAAITVNQPGATRIGTVGRPIPGNAVRISPLGEIELKGDVLFSGYWHNEEATAAVFDDGWFRTGDLGAIDADGFLRIVGRQKEIIVTAGGKNVAPAPLEAILGANPVVGHAMIVGEGRPFVGALVTLDPAGVRQWAQDNGRATDAPLEELARDELLRATIQTSVDEASATVSRAEGIKKFTVLPEDFSEAGGELTPTLKIKRSVVEQKYARQIKHLYGKH